MTLHTFAITQSNATRDRCLVTQNKLPRSVFPRNRDFYRLTCNVYRNITLTRCVVTSCLFGNGTRARDPCEKPRQQRSGFFFVAQSWRVSWNPVNAEGLQTAANHRLGSMTKFLHELDQTRSEKSAPERFFKHLLTLFVKILKKAKWPNKKGEKIQINER